MREVGVALRVSKGETAGRGPWRRGWWILASLVCALAALCVTAAPSQAASAMLWSAPEQINPANPAPSPNYSLGLNAVSCASSSLCVAVEGAGNILTSTDPLDSPSSWATPYSDSSEYLTAVSCASTQLCVAVAQGGDVVTSTDPTDQSITWTASTPVQDTQDGTVSGLDAVSCAPNTTMCVAGGFNGFAVTSASGWQAVPISSSLPAPTITGVSCPSASLCVATFSDGEPGDGNQSGVMTSTNPTGGASAWTVTNLPADGLVGVSCPTVSLCVAISDVYNAGIVTSTDPTGGASAWSAAAGPQSFEPDGVSCASPTLCVDAANYEDAYGEDTDDSTDPAGGPSAWNASVVVPGGITPNQVVVGVSCLPGTTTCVAVDRQRVYVGNAVAADALSVTLAGAGTGEVIANPGIACPAEVCSNLVAGGSPVTLTAMPGEDAFFAGWSSPCPTTAATATTALCSLTMAGNEDITATFDSDQPSCSITPKGSTVLLRRARTRRRGSTGTFTLSATCDQPTRLTVDATIIAMLRKQTKRHKARMRTIKLAPKRVSVTDGVAKAIKLELPRKALVDLEHRKHETIEIAVRARGAYGSSTTSATVPTLHAKRA